ncbi:cell division protein FtsB [Microbacteriaceae bacterium MWH-Ta3]|nr:cell division protein FtsB [Microbacteriaceae bacterium MWH-Ta3]
MTDPRATRQPLWGRSLENSFFWIIVAVIAILAVVSLFEPVQIWFEQRARLAALQEQVEENTAAVAEIQSDIDRWSDPAFIEAQARQRLLYVYPGDISYLVINDVQIEAVPTTVAPKTVENTDINWVDALMASYAAAAVGGTE